MKTQTQYDNPSIGCYIDESAGSADDCNRRTIDFAEDYGFEPGKPSGCFDGTRGLELSIDLDDAESGSHSGDCGEDISELVKLPYISEQLDKIDVEQIRAGLKEYGAWDAEQLADDYENRKRAVWQACCDIKERMSEWLSEVADEAVDYLNGLESRSFLSWGFEDNSLFLSPNVEGAKESVDFISRDKVDETTDPQDSSYPAADYRGEWLHVTDHGNATLYSRGDDGKDIEVWSCV